MKKRYIGEKKPLTYRVMMEAPCYPPKYPPEVSGSRGKRSILSRIIRGKRRGDEQRF